jgi:hypothetical protein
VADTLNRGEAYKSLSIACNKKYKRKDKPVVTIANLTAND